MQQTNFLPGAVFLPAASPLPSRPTAFAARRVEFALACAVVFFAPMNVLRVQSFYFTASDFFACLCIGLMILNRSLPLRPFGVGTAFWLFGLVLMVGALFASSLMAGAIDRGLILSIQYLFAYLILPLIILARPWRETMILMKVFVTSIVLMVLHGIYVVEVLDERNTTFVSGSGRLLGFVERDNECGSLIATTVPMILSMVAMGTMRPLLAIILLPLIAYGIMLTGSNTALYAMLFGFGVFFLGTISFRRVAIGIATVLLLFSAINTPVIRDSLPAVFQKRVLTGIDSGDLNEAGTFAERMRLNQEALRLAGDVVLLGRGADQYREISSWRTPVHNLYLLMWNEGGLIALSGFVVMLIGGVITFCAPLRYRGGHLPFICGFTVLSLFALLINAVPHVYGRFWSVPVLLALAPAVAFLNNGPMHAPRAGLRA
jgi:O-antigen ligase